MRHRHEDVSPDLSNAGGSGNRRVTFRLFPIGNWTFIASIIQPDRIATNDTVAQGSPHDPQGAVMYVVIVVFLWGFSIVLLIASYVRKNQSDRTISLYLEEIKVVRKQSRRQNLIKVVHSIDSRAWCPDLNQRSRSAGTPLLGCSPRPYFFNFHKSRSSGFRGDYEIRDDEAASQWSLGSDDEMLSSSPPPGGGRSVNGIEQA